MFKATHSLEKDRTKLCDFISSISFGALITPADQGLLIDHIPFLMTQGHMREGLGSERQDAIFLEMHLHKGNPHWRHLDGRESTFVIQGPHSYISPSFYPTKAETGRVVPTWSYMVAHIKGIARPQYEAAWLHKHLSSISDRFEEGYEEPWKIDDAPAAYIEGLKRGIIGVEFEVTEISAKFKLNQEKPWQDILGTIDGLAGGDEMSGKLAAELKHMKGDV